MIEKISSAQYAGYFFNNLQEVYADESRKKREKSRINKMFKEEMKKIQPIAEGRLVNILI